MVCSEGSRAVSARSTVRPPTPLSKTPMGASIALQDACTGYLEKGIIHDAEDWLGTAKRTCDWNAPAVASMPHSPAVAGLGTGMLAVPQSALPVRFAPVGSVSVYTTGQAGLTALKSQFKIAEPRRLPTGSASTSTLESRPSSKRALAGCMVW